MYTNIHTHEYSMPQCIRTYIYTRLQHALMHTHTDSHAYSMPSYVHTHTHAYTMPSCIHTHTHTCLQHDHNAHADMNAQPPGHPVPAAAEITPPPPPDRAREEPGSSETRRLPPQRFVPHSSWRKGAARIASSALAFSAAQNWVTKPPHLLFRTPYNGQLLLLHGTRARRAGEVCHRIQVRL